MKKEYFKVLKKTAIYNEDLRLYSGIYPGKERTNLKDIVAVKWDAKFIPDKFFLMMSSIDNSKYFPTAPECFHPIRNFAGCYNI
jgi:hypothetical protein